MKSLSRCGLCKRPMILYAPKKDISKLKKGDYTYQVSGPSTHPNVKRWCHGRCMGIIADVDILIWVLTDNVPKAKRKKLIQWSNDYREDIEDSFNKLIKGLVRGKSS